MEILKTNKFIFQSYFRLLGDFPILIFTNYTQEHTCMPVHICTHTPLWRPLVNNLSSGLMGFVRICCQLEMNMQEGVWDSHL